MSEEKKPTETIRDAAELVCEAAALILELKEAATQNVIVAALLWRYKIPCHYDAVVVYNSAVRLLGVMPRK